MKSRPSRLPRTTARRRPGQALAIVLHQRLGKRRRERELVIGQHRAAGRPSACRRRRLCRRRRRGLHAEGRRREVLANDHLAFTATLPRRRWPTRRAAEPGDVERLCAQPRRPRLHRATFDGLYFPRADHAFLDAAWSHVDELDGAKRALALSALCLAAAWKQPRGVFTVTTPRYDDGRRQLHSRSRRSSARP